MERIEAILSKDFLKSLPRSSGVYVMRNSSGEVIYVGKAKNLKSRVKTYFTGTGDGRLSSSYIQDNVAKIETLFFSATRSAFERMGMVLRFSMTF